MGDVGSSRPDIGERLRRLQRLGSHKGVSRLPPPAPRPAVPGIEAVVEGEWVPTPYGDCFVSETSYPLHYRRGGLALSDCLMLPSSAIAACGGDPVLAELDLRSAAFIDAETTGLAGGTGTLIFLLGIGTFKGPSGAPESPRSHKGKGTETQRELGGDQGSFVIRQFFAQEPVAERAMLHAAAAVLEGCTGVVSYNGRSFDLPLLTTRFIINRLPPRLQEVPHLDLLFPARRLWRARIGSCALGNVEQEALGVRRAQTDVPGWLIPSLYRHYLRSGDAREIGRVFYHNLEDILSLVALTARLGRLFIGADDVSAILGELDPIDRGSLGRWYEELGWIAAGEEAYRRALAGPLPPEMRQRALGRLSFLLKRQDRREEAARLWREWCDEASDSQLAPFVELAKHHEWHVVDLAAALSWTRQAIERAQAWPPSPRRDRALAELQHRLNRLQRKLARAADKK